MDKQTQCEPDGLPLLLGYQTRWIEEQARFAVCEKGRRIGLSWSDASERVIYASEGKGNIMYMSYNKDMTETYIGDCADWARKFQVAVSEVIEEEFVVSNDEKINRFRIELNSGKQIIALSSNPRVLRSKGKPGDIVILDEAAFCDDLAALLKAAIAVTQWGGLVRVISTHNGEGNEFNKLVEEIRSGRHPQWALHTITLDDAINDGLARRVFSVTNRDWYEGADKDWRAEIVNGYTYKEDADEELMCIPSKGGGAWLNWEWIRNAEHDLAGLPDLYMGRFTYIGVDIARRKHFWVAGVLELVGDVLWLRELITRQNIPFKEQGEIVDRLVKRYRPQRVVVDQTGMGEAVVEKWQEDHGERVEGVLLTAPRRLDVATVLRERFEDGTIRIQKDSMLADDLHSIKKDEHSAGSGGPRLIAETKDGHADRFWALGLACLGATAPAGKIEFEGVGERETSVLETDAYMGGMEGVHEMPGWMM